MPIFLTARAAQPSWENISYAALMSIHISCALCVYHPFICLKQIDSYMTQLKLKRRTDSEYFLVKSPLTHSFLHSFVCSCFLLARFFSPYTFAVLAVLVVYAYYVRFSSYVMSYKRLCALRWIFNANETVLTECAPHSRSLLQMQGTFLINVS